MKKTTYPRWKTALWLIGSFLYTIAALTLTLFLLDWVNMHYISGSPAPFYVLGFGLLLLAILPCQAYKHRHSLLPALIAEVEMSTILLIVVYVTYTARTLGFGQFSP